MGGSPPSQLQKRPVNFILEEVPSPPNKLNLIYFISLTLAQITSLWCDSEPQRPLCERCYETNSRSAIRSSSRRSKITDVTIPVSHPPSPTETRRAAHHPPLHRLCQRIWVFMPDAEAAQAQRTWQNGELERVGEAHRASCRSVQLTSSWKKFQVRQINLI